MPGYPGNNLAKLLHENQQGFLFLQEIVQAGERSVAFQLARIRRVDFYPYGASFAVTFAGDPGAFVIDIEVADVDEDANYTVIAQLSDTAGSHYDMTNNFPRFIRASVVSIANAVPVTLAVERSAAIAAAAGAAQVYPPAGIAVSTGTAWGTAIDPATVPRLNTSNTFTGAISAPAITQGTNPVLVANTTNTLTAATTINNGANILTIAGSANGTISGTIYLGASTPTNAVTIRGGQFASSLQWFSPLYLGTPNLNTVQSTSGNGDFFAGAASVNGPPQLTGQTTVGLFTHVGSTAGYQFQTAWNNNDTTPVSRIIIRNQTAGGVWTPWTELLHDDGAGNFHMTGNLVVDGTITQAGVPVTFAAAVSSDTVAALEARIAALEARLAELEG